MADSHVQAIVDPGASSNGITIVSGGPGSGKSHLAIGASIEAARSGASVHYITSDMPARIVANRALTYCGGHPPESWRIVELRPGADLSTLAELVEPELQQLVVVDTAQGLLEESGTLRELVRWARSVRRETRGRVSFLLVCEGSEPRVAWADRVVCMENDRRRSRLKYMHVVGSDPVRVLLNPTTARLASIGPVRADHGGRFDA